MKKESKKEVMYDLGMFGKWSKASFEENVGMTLLMYSSYPVKGIKPSSPLGLVMTNKKPVSPELDEDLFNVTKGLFGILKVAFNQFYSRTSFIIAFNNCVQDNVDYVLDMREYRQAVYKVNALARKVKLK